MKLDPNQRISRLSLEKRALLEAYLLKLQGKKSGAGGIPRRGEGSTWPLSFGQERLWFLHTLEPQKSWYNAPHAFRLEGNLEVSALEQALNEVVRRHEVLRTRYESVDGRPLQVLGEPGRVVLRHVDLRDWPEAEKAVEVNRLITDEASREFELSRDLMVRGALVREQDTSWVLLLVVHHIATDEWSQGILFRELGQLYEAFRRGESGSVEELPNQYADYAVWQRQRLSGEILEQQLGYWKQQLGADELPLLELPTDRARPVVLSHRGERVAFELPIHLSLQARDLARREGSTLFMTLLAVFNVLLYRYTSHTDLFVGTPIAGRTRRELEGLIGFFVNTLVLRTNLSGDPSFRELLGRVRQTVLGAYAHQELPFERLVEELHPERSTSRNPLFEVMFVLANTPGFGLELDEINVSPVAVDTGTAKFDLTLSMLDQGQGLAAWIEYNTDLYDRATIERLLGHFRTLLTGIVADPEQRISQLPLLAEVERHQMLVEWNATQNQYPGGRCIHELFEEQVKRTPEAVAVLHESQALTYQELNCRANRLGHYLRRMGIGPEVLIGICVDRGIEMIVGLLGILKAGGAYVPLDPVYPRNRLNFMLKDARVRMVVTTAALLHDLPELEAQVVCLDTEWHPISQESEANLIREGTAENLAYVMYTSGSTGRPKGVQISQRAMVNLLTALQHKPGVQPEDTLLAVTTLSFDIAGLEIYLPLLVGAKVVVATRETATDGTQLMELMGNSGTTVMQATPATWRLLLSAGWKGNRAIKVLCGGEALPLDLARDLLSRCASLWNLYGPTETTVWSTLCEVKSSDPIITVGKPIPNTRVYLLDKQMQTVPVGVPGELYIGGLGVARGYVESPDLTSQRFVPDPYGQTEGERLYRTGDLARYLPDGNIEFLGRIDNQVKIRGFRIELGEIESALCRHSSVDQAVVICREDSVEKRLVAYFTVNRDGTSITDLRNFLKNQVPEYMVPAVFVHLDKLPLTANGKVDHRALPAPDWHRRESEASYVAPRTQVEESLVGIWAEVLKKEPVGIRDNFFELGGHSLLATQVVARIQARLGVEVSLRAMFDNPTLAELARAIEQARPKGPSPVQPIPRTPVE